MSTRMSVLAHVRIYFCGSLSLALSRSLCFSVSLAGRWVCVSVVLNVELKLDKASLSLHTVGFLFVVSTGLIAVFQ